MNLEDLADGLMAALTPDPNSGRLGIGVDAFRKQFGASDATRACREVICRYLADVISKSVDSDVSARLGRIEAALEELKEMLSSSNRTSDGPPQGGFK